MYKILYVDPPWHYPKRRAGTKFGGGVHDKYKTMSNADLLSMADYVKSLSDKNSAILMWATCPRLDFAMELIKEWGFRYSTVAFSWIKGTKTVKLPVPVTVVTPDKKSIELPAGTIVPAYMIDERTVIGLKTIVGPGNYTGSNLEVVLLGVKGSMPPERRLVPQVIVHPRMQHSKKPEEIRDRIVSAFGDLPRIELFARDKAPGWEASGLELDGTDYTKMRVAQVGATPLIVPAA